MKIFPYLVALGTVVTLAPSTEAKKHKKSKKEITPKQPMWPSSDSFASTTGLDFNRFLSEDNSEVYCKVTPGNEVLIADCQTEVLLAGNSIFEYVDEDQTMFSQPASLGNVPPSIHMDPETGKPKISYLENLDGKSAYKFTSMSYDEDADKFTDEAWKGNIGSKKSPVEGIVQAAAMAPSEVLIHHSKNQIEAITLTKDGEISSKMLKNRELTGDKDDYNNLTNWSRFGKDAVLMQQITQDGKYEEVLISVGHEMSKVSPTVAISTMEMFGETTEPAEVKKIQTNDYSGYLVRNYVNEEMEDFRFEILKDSLVKEEYKVVTQRPLRFDEKYTGLYDVKFLNDTIKMAYTTEENEDHFLNIELLKDFDTPIQHLKVALEERPSTLWFLDDFTVMYQVGQNKIMEVTTCPLDMLYISEEDECAQPSEGGIF
jgi:hypothetical protein